MPKGLPRALSRRNRTLSPSLETVSVALGSPVVGATTAVMTAFTDNAIYHRFYNAAVIGGFSRAVAIKITATSGGTAADIKAIQVTVIGTDSADAPLTEALPVFTVNTATTVTSVGSFKTVTSIAIPAHDGTGATTSVGVFGGGVADILAAWTDVGAAATIKTATITNPAVPRNITATSGGTAGDIGAIQAIVGGTSRDGVAITETLPIFTANSATTVVGDKAFATVTYIDLPVHDGTGATTAFGHGAKLGLPYKLTRDTVVAAFLADAREATRPTVVVSATAMASNTITLSTTLNTTAVIVHLMI